MSEHAGFEVVLGAFADLGDKIDKTSGKVDKLSPAVPLHTSPFGSVNSGASPPNPLLLVANNPLTPAAGRTWHLRSIGIYGPDEHTVIGVNSSAAAANNVVLGASGVASFNNNPYTVAITVAGGTVTQIAVNGIVTGLTSGTFYVPAAGSIAVTYTVAPTTFTTAQVAAFVPSQADLYAGTPPAIQTASQPVVPQLPDAISGDSNFPQAGSPSAIPTFQQFTTKAIWLRHGESVYALVYNVPANTTLTLVVAVEDWALCDVEATKI